MSNWWVIWFRYLFSCVCVCVFCLTLISRWLLRNMGRAFQNVAKPVTSYDTLGAGPRTPMPSGTQGRVILSINSNEEKMERKGSKQREQQASEFLYFRRFYLLRLRLNNLCGNLTKRIPSNIGLMFVWLTFKRILWRCDVLQFFHKPLLEKSWLQRISNHTRVELNKNIVYESLSLRISFHPIY